MQGALPGITFAFCTVLALDAFKTASKKSTQKYIIEIFFLYSKSSQVQLRLVILDPAPVTQRSWCKSYVQDQTVNCQGNSQDLSDLSVNLFFRNRRDIHQNYAANWNIHPSVRSNLGEKNDRNALLLSSTPAPLHELLCSTLLSLPLLDSTLLTLPTLLFRALFSDCQHGFWFLELYNISTDHGRQKHDGPRGANVVNFFGISNFHFWKWVKPDASRISGPFLMSWTMDIWFRSVFNFLFDLDFNFVGYPSPEIKWALRLQSLFPIVVAFSCKCSGFELGHQPSSMVRPGPDLSLYDKVQVVICLSLPLELRGTWTNSRMSIPRLETNSGVNVAVMWLLCCHGKPFNTAGTKGIGAFPSVNYCNLSGSQ